MVTSPAFILSSPRSGSTLFRVMLAGHPELFCPPELNLLPFRTMGDRDAVLGQCSSQECQDPGCDEREGLLRAVIELTGDDLEAARLRAADLVGCDTRTAEVYRLMAELAAPRRLVDKSPLNVARTSWLRRAEEIGSGVQYLHLVRHPAAVMASLVRNHTDIAGSADATLLAELVWTAANSNIVAFLAGIPPQRQHLVRYEDLVTDPAVTMAGVLEFLGVSPHDAVLDPYRGARMTDGVRPNRPSLGDPLFLTHTGLDPTLADAWRSVQLPYGLGEPAADLAAGLGYDRAMLAESNVSPEPMRSTAAADLS